jgi:hypothetical protein
MCWISEVNASKNESGCDVPKVLSGWVRRGTISRIDGDPFSSTGYKRVNKKPAHNEINSTHDTTQGSR